MSIRMAVKSPHYSIDLFSELCYSIRVGPRTYPGARGPSYSMSRLSRFVEGASNVASIQEHLLEVMAHLFTDEEYHAIEATVLAPGYEGWEGRALRVIKDTTKERWDSLGSQVERFQAKFKAGVPYPNQDTELPPLSDKTAPHLRAYWCLKCGYRITSMALSGICCHGQPECSRCHHVLHEPNCRRKSQPEKERK